MKVVQINATYGIGSTGCIVEEIHEFLLSQNVDSYVFCATSKRDKTKNVFQVGNAMDHKIHAVLRRIDFKQGFHSRLATKNLVSKLKEIKPDVVQLHNLHSNYINFPILFDYLAKQNVATVVTLHDAWFFTGGCMRPNGIKCEEWKNECNDCKHFPVKATKNINKMFSAKSEAYKKMQNLYVASVSNWLMKNAKESCLSSAKGFNCINNWIDVDERVPKRTRAEICQKYGLDPNKKIILGVAQGWSLTRSKGGIEFNEIATKLCDKVEVVLVGNNNGMPETKGLHCIGYLSNKQDLMDVYGAADLFVNASSFEAFGLVTIEAMSVGTPVVAYNNTGSAEIIKDGCGVLVEDGNKEELVRIVSQLINEDKVNISQKLISYVKENFDKQQQLQKYLTFFKDVSESK